MGTGLVVKLDRHEYNGAILGCKEIAMRPLRRWGNLMRWCFGGKVVNTSICASNHSFMLMIIPTFLASF